MAIKKLRKPLEIANDGTAITGVGYDSNGNPVVQLLGPGDKRSKSVQYSGMISKIYIDELRDGSFLDRKDDIKKLLKYKREFQSKVKKADDITGAFVDIYDAVGNLVEVAHDENIDIKPYIKTLQEVTKRVTKVRDAIQGYDKEIESTVASKSVKLSFSDYDNLIDELYTLNFYIKDKKGDTVILDWKSGTGVELTWDIDFLDGVEVSNVKFVNENENDSLTPAVNDILQKYMGKDITSSKNQQADSVKDAIKILDITVEHDDEYDCDVYMIDNNRINFSSIEEMIESILVFYYEHNHDYVDAVDFLSSLSYVDEVSNKDRSISYPVSDIADYLDDITEQFETDYDVN